MKLNRCFVALASIYLLLLLAACSTQPQAAFSSQGQSQATQTSPADANMFPGRPAYDPGTQVDYIAQSADTISALAARFNTSAAEIMQANPVIPQNVTSLPPGFPMKIPIYYRAFWGSQYRILPDALFPNGPAQIDFDSQQFAASQPGWLKDFEGSAAQEMLSGPQIVDLVATNFSISPRFLFALLDYLPGALTQQQLSPSDELYPLGYQSEFHQGLYLQLVWAANVLNNGYYAWRSGKMIEFEMPDGSLYRPDPWQNASSVALQYFFANLLTMQDFYQAIGPQGFAQSYADLFGDPWLSSYEHIPGSLQQPEFRLPFIPGDLWTHTGGPHTGWGSGEPWAALDFAPGLESSGCVQTDIWATAIADGLVVRTALGTLVLDLDADGDERTGWVIFYLHLEERDRPQVGALLLAGQPLGHASCEGGSSTGTHVHIARKYNGEWIAAAGDLPFVMEEWLPMETGPEYFGTLSKPGRTVTACRCSDAGSSISSFAAAVDFPTPSAFDLPLPSQTPE